MTPLEFEKIYDTATKRLKAILKERGHDYTTKDVFETVDAAAVMCRVTPVEILNMFMAVKLSRIVNFKTGKIPKGEGVLNSLDDIRNYATMLEAYLQMSATKPLLKEKIEAAIQQRTMLDLKWRPEYTQDHFWATSFGDCDRKLAYNWIGAPKEPIDPQGRRVFDVGDEMHERYGRYVEYTGTLRRLEIPHRDETFSIRADGIIEIDNEPYLIEFKSINTFGFKNVKYGKISPGYLKQVLITCYLAKVRKCIMVFENKNSQYMEEVLIDTEDPKYAHLWTEIENTVKAVHKAMEEWPNKGAAGLPPRPPKKKITYCRKYCQFWKACWEPDESIA